MKIYLLRHGETAYNKEKRYQGCRDIPLSAAGRAELAAAPFAPAAVYVSPLSRARETASILFPGARQLVIDDLREMCFGVFEGRNYREMEHDPDYLRWVGGDGLGKIPGGESKAEFCARTCAAFAPLVGRALAAGESTLVIVAHGGTQMAVMERYAAPHQEYYRWCAPNGGGYLLETTPAQWRNGQCLRLCAALQYTTHPKEAPLC